MIKITGWRPDTCDCVISYRWDDEVAQDERVHELESIQKCIHHQNETDDNAYSLVKDENVTKNQSLGVILENNPDISEDVLDENDKIIGKQLKDGFVYNWSFDQDRKLNIEIPDLSSDKKVEIKDQLDSALGVDKVSVL